MMIHAAGIFKETYHRNDVRDTISTVNDNTRQRSFFDRSRRPTSCKRQHRLHRDVKTRHVEGLKHNFRCVFAILGRVEWRFGEQEVMVAGLGAEILEDALLQEALHQVPIFDDTVSNGILKDNNVEGGARGIKDKGKLTFTA